MSNTVYTKIGEIDGEKDGIMNLPSVDTLLFTAPNSVATYTAFKAQITSMSGAGAIQISFNGIKYLIPALAAEDTDN